jgi:phage tail protein X
MTAARTAAGNLPKGRFYVTHTGDRLDQIAQAVYGRQVGVVEALLLANPGLARFDVWLPEGIAIEVPKLDLTSDSAQEVSLWS